MFCVDEMNQWLEKLEQGIPIFTLVTIDKYIECAKKQNLVTQYFSVVNCGFIIYKDTTIYLTSEDGGTTLSLSPILV